MVLHLRKERAIRASSRRMLNQDTPSPSCAATRTATGTPTSSSSSVIKKKTKKSRGKARNKTRNPKYLSLRLQLFSTDQKPQDQSTEMPTRDDHLQPQLNLFPRHPQTCLVQDKDVHDENMAYLFSSADGGATTLAGLLGAATTASSTSSDEDLKKTRSTTTITLSPSASLTYAYRRQDSEEEVALVRTAIRNKEREPSEERWVRYSEVVERRDDQEVSSCCAAADLRSWRNRRLSLKLDYKEILNAWSDKGPLYIHDAAADSPQTVPDDILASQLSNESSDVWGSNGGCVWRVPEMIMSKANEQGLRHIEVKTEEQQEQVGMVAEELKVEKREAIVQRYKEKRQNRLFSKRIRYQVRKLNAEKRPRLKGRFVKRS